MSQFGQPPLAALLPLKAGQNLADLPDKAAALVNLGTLSSSDIMMNAVPIGTIIAFWGATAPTGYLPCNGQTVNSGTFPDLVTFLGGGSSQALPDLRGEFLRGWDNGRGVDTGRNIRSAQSSQNLRHTHPISLTTVSEVTAGQFNPASWVANSALSKIMTQDSSPVDNGSVDPLDWAASGGSESRPRNVAVQYCMKAYGALVNTATANIGNVLTELSQTVKTTQFENSLGANGYQKLPGGLILQWGSVGAIAGNASITTNFPIAFPNGVLSLATSRKSSNLDSVRYPVSWMSTNSVLTVYADDNGVDNATYIAIGY